MKFALIVGASVLALSSASFAQGIGTKVPGYTFTVPGVLNTTALATVFQCTNMSPLGSGVLNFEVDLFASDGSLANSAAVTLGGGETKIIATQPLGSMATDATLFTPSGGGTPVVAGAARILGGKLMICAASVMSASVNPSYLNALPVIRKKLQHGA